MRRKGVVEDIARLRGMAQACPPSLDEQIELDRHEKTVAAVDKKRLEAEQQALRAGNPPGELDPYRASILAEADKKLAAPVPGTPPHAQTTTVNGVQPASPSTTSTGPGSSSGGGDNGSATYTVDGGGGTAPDNSSSTHSSSGSLPPGASSTAVGHATPGGIDSGSPPPGAASRPSTGVKSSAAFDVEGSKRLIANLDKEKAHHPLHPKQEADYNQARQVVARDAVERLQKQSTPLTDAQKQEMADALHTLGEGKDASAARGTDGRRQRGRCRIARGRPVATIRAGSPGGNDPRGVELPGGRRDGGGGSPDSNLVLAGGGDGGHQPLQGGAAAEVPPSVSAGGQLPDAVGQMMSGPTGAGDMDGPRASAGHDNHGKQPPQLSAKDPAGGLPVDDHAQTWNEGGEAMGDEQLPDGSLADASLRSSHPGNDASVPVEKTTAPPHLTGDTKASVDHKLQTYLLNPDHPVGGAKAKWYRQALGFTRENADELARQLVFDRETAVPTIKTNHGQKFSQTIPIKGPNGRTIEVVIIWIRNLDGVIGMVTAPPPKKK